PSAVTSLAAFQDTVMAGTANGVYSLSGGVFQPVPGTSGKPIVSMVSTAGAWWYVWNGSTGFTVETQSSIGSPVTTVASYSSDQSSSLSVDPVSSVVAVGTFNSGVLEWNGTVWTTRVPNGPQANAFINLCIDGGGVLWAGSGLDGGGKGFYRFNPQLPDSLQWKNFTVGQYSILGSNDYYKASVGADGSVWVSSWGDGVVQVVGDTIRRKLNTTSRPSFAATIGSTFVVIGGVAVDPAGETWFVDRTAVNGNFLAKFVDDSTFQYFRNSYNPGDGTLSSMVIDQNGTRWIANSEPTKKVSSGLYYFNDDLSVVGTAPYNGWGNMSTGEGLTNSTVLSLAVDQDNNIWVGTDLGITIITNALDPKDYFMSSFPLREQSIQAIAVDALNNKWIGTKQGVFVVNPDGTQLLNQYTVLSTGGRLVDDDVRAIAVDQHRGIVYVGTQKGLSALQIAAVQSLRSYTTIQVAPNPYVLPSSLPLTINNLVSSSTIKILTVNGMLMTQFAAQGAGRAFWDGKDSRGSYVPSGIYYIVAFTENGNKVANGKVAVVRK
ncbi:MAG TPA: two-component regulator propeller domain-containing protein, partial [Bacteroidota bacterium]|nr:two-component regulator propeller domain-containing protein [Bacteroidota bacterium]